MHPGDPFQLFTEAFERAALREPFEVNAMSLATVDAQGLPSVRIVLLKEVDERGFVFFTNYESRKGRELDGQKVAALSFHWPTGEEQVRIEGSVARVSAEESDVYFATRPRLSQIGAWASLQSRPLGERATLDKRVEELSAKYEGKDVPRPPMWGGYVVAPRRIEFWYGRANRLHDRHVYERQDVRAPWTHQVLYP